MIVIEYYENVFDAIQVVKHDKKDKTVIHKFHGVGGVGHEMVRFLQPVRALGNMRIGFFLFCKTCSKQ